MGKSYIQISKSNIILCLSAEMFVKDYYTETCHKAVGLQSVGEALEFAKFGKRYVYHGDQKALSTDRKAGLGVYCQTLLSSYAASIVFVKRSPCSYTPS